MGYSSSRFSLVLPLHYKKIVFSALPIYWLLSTVLFGTSYGATIEVPNQYLTIQAAINAAQPGDTVLVASGTYHENIDFGGKDIIVKSQNGAADAVIDGGRADSVVKFWNAEKSSTVLNGFTIRNGLAPNSFFLGGGISIRNASPTITNCHIKRNGAHDGGGIYVEGEESSPVIEGNVISENIGTTVGGGIEIRDGASPSIKNNVINDNLAMNGSGVYIANGAAPSVEGNTINGNNAGCCIPYELAEEYLDGVDVTQGIGCGDWFPSAILIGDHSSPLIKNNEITGNIGGGMSILVSSAPIINNNQINGNVAGHPLAGGILIAGDCAPVLTDNTIEDNQAGAIWIDASSRIIDGEGKAISLEGFSIIEDSDPSFTYSGQWDLGIGNVYSGGTRRAAGETGATASLNFIGTGVSLIYFADSGSGIADITIDGKAYASIDTYSADIREENGKNEQVITTGLSLSEHVLTITVSGRKNPLSTGPGIVLDAVGTMPTTSIGSNYVRGSVYAWPTSFTRTEGSLSDKTLKVPGQYGTIQGAIAASYSGDTIIVSPGEYTENLDFLGKNIVVRSQNPADLTTVQQTIIDAQKDWPTVLFANGEGREARLEGFTIQNGFGHKAVQICGSSPTISNNIIKDSAGGGIYCTHSDSPLIKANVIENNGADSNIAVYCSLCSAEIKNNTITGNTGCGIGSYFSKPSIVDNTISLNISKGGTDAGIYLDHMSPAIVQGNDISENKTLEDSGGVGIILDFFSDALIEGNLVTDNDTSGLFMIIDCSPIIENNLIEGNNQALYASVSRPQLENNTIVENGNGIYAVDISDIIVRNTILKNEYDIGLDAFAEASVTHSLVSSGWPGEGNFTQEPGFVGAEDYHLRENSPCIDTGTSAGAPDTDLGGVTRPQGSGYEVGAHEFIHPVIPTVNTTPASLLNPNGAITGGRVVSDGGASITDKGICWSTSANPTTGDFCSSNDTRTMSFSSYITGLNPGTTYHIRAYATNSAGTGYGNDLYFGTTYTSILYVSVNGGCGTKTPCYDSIQDAIDDAETGSAILVKHGIYRESISLGSVKSLMIKGGYDSAYNQQTPNTTYIQGIGQTTIQATSGSLKFQMLTIKHD